MIIMLFDHILQHSFCLLLINLSAQPAAAPGNFFPDEDAETIAEIENDARLLVMTQANKIHSHFLHHYHFCSHLIFCHSGRYTRMIFMTLGAADQQSFSIQQERALLYKFDMAEAELLVFGIIVNFYFNRI